MAGSWHCMVGNSPLPRLQDIRFHLYTRRNPDEPEVFQLEELSEPMQIDQPQLSDITFGIRKRRAILENGGVRAGRTIRAAEVESQYLSHQEGIKVLIHDFSQTSHTRLISNIKTEYLRAGEHNVFVVDWSRLPSAQCYAAAATHLRYVGEVTARMLDHLALSGVDADAVHVVAHGLGAHIAGFVGGAVQLASVARITGLDPAAPAQGDVEPMRTLDKGDAKFVDVIHTDAGTLGLEDRMGHADFYPNGGSKQPGCLLENVLCSHNRAARYFAESLRSDQRFVGKSCRSWEDFMQGACHDSPKSLMGEPCLNRTEGKYYLYTGSQPPFALDNS